MALYLKNHTIFLHIPKTGGNWVTKILEEQNLVQGELGHKHSDASRLLVPPLHRTSLKHYMRYAKIAHKMRKNPSPQMFCVVRDPFKWYESFYKYQVGKKWKAHGTHGNLIDWHVNSPFNLNTMFNGREPSDFSDFMHKVSLEAPGYVSHLYDRFTNCGNVSVLHLENIRDELSNYLVNNGFAINQDEIVRSKDFGVSPSLSIEWDPKIKKKVAEQDMLAFSKYGYDSLI